MDIAYTITAILVSVFGTMAAFTDNYQKKVEHLLWGIFILLAYIADNIGG